MHEAAAVATLVAAIVLLGFIVPLWLTARRLSPRRRLTSLLCPMSQVAVVALAHVAVRGERIGGVSALTVAACALACALLDVAVLRAIVEAEGVGAAQERARVAQEQLGAQREHLRALERARDKSSRLREDVASVFAAVSSSLEAGEKDRALELLDAGGARTGAPARVPCANPVVSALLSAKADYCDELGILWRCTCELPERIDIPSVELCVLLSNLLDNAIEAARARVGAGAFVSSTLSVRHGFLVVRVENSYDSRDKVADGSAEGVLPERGWGMQILGQLVSSRDGELVSSGDGRVWSVRAIVRQDG